jgi:hypothetical protein
VFFGIFPLAALPMSFIGAAMGAVITGVITVVLLDGQARAEEEKEKNLQIFKMKSEIFQKYIDLVWEIWNDQKITSEEYKKLLSDYYRYLMIYLEDAKLKIIGDRLTDMGNCLEKESFENYKSLRENIITIINTLSDELNLGGHIIGETIEKHDEKMFPALFRKELLKCFNENLLNAYSDILEEGQWIKWNEGPNTIHDNMIFKLKNIPNCSLRYGFAMNKNNKDYNKSFITLLVVPVGAHCHDFDKYRIAQTGIYNQRLTIEGSRDLYVITNQEEENITPFCFFDDANQNNLKNIREKSNYIDISEILAKRAVENIRELTVKSKDGERLAIIDFWERHGNK